MENNGEKYPHSELLSGAYGRQIQIQPLVHGIVQTVFGKLSHSALLGGLSFL